MEDNSELLMKYQKLAHEYSKLKAQTSVLKTAVAEEQAAASELQETQKKKDQLIRKLEQEVDCLNFRNLQLTKRVSILQTDLEGVDANSKHSKNKHTSNSSTPLPDSYGVLNLELQSRIEENEKLHKQVYAADIEHRKEVTELSSTIDKLQNDLKDQQRKLNEKIEEQDTLISTLQKEKIKMQITLKNYEKELKDNKNKEQINEKDNSSLQEDLQIQLEEATTVITDKILFNDTRIDTLNSLNVPILQRGKHQLLCSLMLNMQELISDFCRQLSDLYTFMIQRLCSPALISSIPEITVKELESDLRESITHIKTIPSNFEKITSAIKDESLTWDKSPVLEFSIAFQKYVVFLDKLMPYLILRIQNKESWISSSPKAIELIPKLVTLCRKLMNCFKTLSKYLDLLQAIGSEGKKVYIVNQSVTIQSILSNLETLQLSFDEARKLFGSKVALDHQLPTISQDEKNTDECILSSLVSLSSTLKKLIDMMTKDIDMISCDIWFKPKNSSKLYNGTVNSCAWQFKTRGSKYFQHINQPEMPSIPYEVALENNKKLQDHSDNQQNLTQQLEHYQTKLMQLELDKEKWMLECTLMKAKESKNHVNVSDEELKAQGNDEIHQYVQTTVNQLIQQIQFADSKFIAYRNECETLHQKLKMCYQKKETLESEITTSRQTIDRMKDEQKTLMHSYEDQLNTMSEHLANLNETLTAQKDEIDALKQAGGKGLKKGKLR